MVQQTLLPVERAEAEQRTVPLSALPPNDELIGDPPDAALIASIAHWGLLQPVVLFAGRHGYCVAAGRRRVKAARAAGLEEIPAMVFQEGYSADAVTIIENDRRSRNAVADLDAILRLVEEGHSEEEIARATGMRRSTIQARLRLVGLNGVLLTALRKGKIRIGVAEAAARLSKHDQVALLEALNRNGKLTQADVKAVRQRTAAVVAQALPDDLFVEDWRDRARTLVQALRAVVPPGAATVVDEHIAGLLEGLAA